MAMYGYLKDAEQAFIDMKIICRINTNEIIEIENKSGEYLRDIFEKDFLKEGNYDH